jgi:hypothetical protein
MIFKDVQILMENVEIRSEILMEINNLGGLNKEISGEVKDYNSNHIIIENDYDETHSVNKDEKVYHHKNETEKQNIGKFVKAEIK